MPAGFIRLSDERAMLTRRRTISDSAVEIDTRRADTQVGPYEFVERADPAMLMTQPITATVGAHLCVRPEIRSVPWIALRFIQAIVARIPFRFTDPGLGAPTLMLRIASILVLLALLAVNAGAENVKIGIPSISVTTMPLAVAKEQGFFQKEGLSVDVIMMPASLNIKVLLSGEIQYATTVGSAVVAAVRGINTRVVMCFVDRPLLDLVATPEIRSISDLKGKLLGISSRGGLHDVSMRAILTQSGIDPAQTTLLTVGTQGSMFAALKAGRISAGLLNPPQNFIAYREGLKNLAFAGNYVRLPSTGLVTLKDTLDHSPDQVRRMIRALTRARSFARDNKAATVGILKRFLRMDDEDLAAKIYDYHKRAETPDGKIDAALAAETIRDTRQAEAITREIPVNQVFDFSYLDSAN
jgi:ABC-type nitrate/sulfonate/bicarbonate transport system substrate-binding protein